MCACKRERKRKKRGKKAKKRHQWQRKISEEHSWVVPYTWLDTSRNYLWLDLTSTKSVCVCSSNCETSFLDRSSSRCSPQCPSGRRVLLMKQKWCLLISWWIHRIVTGVLYRLLLRSRSEGEARKHLRNIFALIFHVCNGKSMLRVSHSWSTLNGLLYSALALPLTL